MSNAKLGTLIDKVREQRDKRGHFITTYSGAKFFIEDANVEDIPLFDIAHALSQNCRYNGHLERFYSVAEHSCIVADYVKGGSQDPKLRRTALLHDLSEAFVPDIPRPFKPFINGFEEMEEKIMESAAKVFDIYWPFPEEVIWVDQNIVRAEAEKLYRNPPDWTKYYEDVVDQKDITGWEPRYARDQWLSYFYYLEKQ
jgi:hypothetical protein